MKTTIETVNVNEVKNQIKANFESMNFDEAVKANQELFKQYEEIKGKRSLTALVSYYRSKSKSETAADNEAKSDSDAVPVEENAQEVEMPDNTDTEPEESYTFDVLYGIGVFSEDNIRSLVESGNPIINKFCVIREFFKQESDTVTIRNTRMFVKNDGDGYERWNDARATANTNGIKSYKKPGNFDLSNDGYPVGLECCSVSVMRIRDAFQKFLFDRKGETRLLRAESIDIKIMA